MGKIASGKGTQAHFICEQFGGVLYSNGNRVRAVIEEPTVFGMRMREMYESGQLMPEWVASYWMTHALIAEHAGERIIFEGVARKPYEAELFHEIHAWIGRPYIVFHINVSDDVVRERSALRSRDALDAAHVVEKRLEEYQIHTAQSVEIFRHKGMLFDIDGNGTVDSVREQIFNHLIKATE